MVSLCLSTTKAVKYPVHWSEFCTLYSQSNFKRLALIIGNANYVSFETLTNTLKDSKDVKTKLESFEFDVAHEQDSFRHEMLSALQQLIDQMNSDNLSDVVFYYAGHGCSIREYTDRLIFISSK